MARKSRTSKYVFNTKSTLSLTQDELKECYSLYNSNYGNYRLDYVKKPGGSVTFPMDNYRRYMQEDFYVATARYNGELVAHAFYIRKRYPEYGIMTWVLQLVVDKRYRKMGIAGTLLHSVWGFSDDYAWGLATANPCTVKTLESATGRRCNPRIISQNIDAVSTIGKDTTFINAEDFDINNHQSCVNTRFFVDNSSYESIEETESKLGRLKPGYEWVAMTFQHQPINKRKYKQNLGQWIAFSEDKLKEAYSRMEMSNHPWTSKTPNEVDFMQRYLRGKTVLDMGCGTGRHSIELSKRGYEVTGIDFVERNIEKAKELAYEQNDFRASFLVDDIRGTRFGRKYDNVICLYDVIGSFPDERDNMRIIKSAYDNLEDGGIAIISVMNMELTESVVSADNIVSVKSNPDALIKLRASKIMQQTGDVFEADSMLIDQDTGLVYRKEQFDNNDELAAEFVIRDKRYKMSEIVSKLEKVGFCVIESRYTHAGFVDSLTATDKKAKEILIVARKDIRS